MKRWKISTQFWSILAIAWMVGTGAAAFLLYRVGRISATYNLTFTQVMELQDNARVMQVTVKKQVQEWKDILLRGHDPAALAKYTKAFHQQEEKVGGLANELKRAAEDPETQSLLSNFARAHAQMSESYGRALSAFTIAKGQNPYEADAMVKGQDRAPTDLIDKIAAREVALVHSRMAAENDAVARERRLVVLVLVTGLLAVAAISIAVVRRMNGSLRRTVLALTEGSHQVAAAASEVSSSGQALAQATSQQAASLQETSSSGVQITAMAEQDADKSKRSAQLMDQVDSRVSEANQTLDQMITSMREINASSEKISRIIKVIDEIAFQTNILALNAAVEAARAGEAGLGFAVVADEVRNLAQRSAQAAKDTAELIEESIAHANAGSGKLERVAAAIRAITESTLEVKTLASELHLDNEEQARAIAQISKALSQIEGATQNVAANAEESASASDELNANATALQQVAIDLRSMVAD